MFEIIDPINYPGYDQLVRDANGSIFHTSNWAKVLAESYRYRPLYFAEIQNGKYISLIPCMEVNSIITGRRGVSLPFSDFCEPIITDNDTYLELFDNIIEYGKKAKWRTAEFRTGHPLPAASQASALFLRHNLDLSRKEEEIFASFKDATKRNINKAVKSGVAISMSTTESSLNQFYRLNCITRREHGLPPQPYRFFRNILKHILDKGLGTIVLASHENRTIAAAVYFQFNGKAIYKYGASDMQYQHLRGNNLVMWEAIKKYRIDGCNSFDFGRTEPKNTGLLQFKRGWGADENSINYYKYDLIKNSFVKNAPMVTGFYNKIFRTIPMPVLKITGSLLYRHVG